MRIVLIPLLFIVCSALYGDYEYFQKLKDQQFGKLILSTIQTEFKASNSVDRILELLRQMQADLAKQSEIENEQNKGFASTCTENLEAIDILLKKSTERKADKERLLPLAKEEQKDKKRQADDKLSEEERNTMKINELTKVRTEERSEYEERRDELTFLAGNLQTAKKIFSKLDNGSFLQTKQTIYVQLQEQHQKLSKLPVSYFYQVSKFPSQHKMMSLLLEIASDPSIQANQQLVQKLLNLFDDLINSIFDLQSQEMKAEASKEQTYQNQIARLNLRNRRLEGTIAELKAAVQLSEQAILELNNDINSLLEIITNKTTELSDWNATCNVKQATYDQEKSNRNDRLDILQKCIEIFEIGVEDVPQFIQTLEIN